MMSKKIWRHIDESKVSASYGLASDEYLMNSQVNPDCTYSATLKLYTYRNYAALCGRFQDLSAEIDVNACKANGVDIGRRLTGGGAIIMGENQLGICLTTDSNTFKWNHIRELYQQFSEPIIAALRDYNIHAAFRSKNDLEVAGKKIAGLGIYVSPEGGIQFHSSLLLDLDIPEMLKVLRIPVQKYSDKRMIHSIEQRMTTVRREASESVGMEQLKQSMLQLYKKQFDTTVEVLPFSVNEQTQIAELQQKRYSSDEWLYQLSPQQDMDGMSIKKTSAGLLRTYIALKGETIKSVLITGDFMDMPDSFSQIESQLKWSPLNREKIANTVRTAFGNPTTIPSEFSITPDEVSETIWLAAQRAFAAKKYTYKGSCYYPKHQQVLESSDIETTATQ